MIRVRLPFEISDEIIIFARNEDDFEDFDFLKLFFEGEEENIEELLKEIVKDNSNFITFLNNCNSLEELLLKIYLLGIFMGKLAVMVMMEQVGTKKCKQILEEFISRILELPKKEFLKEIKKFIKDLKVFKEGEK